MKLLHIVTVPDSLIFLKGQCSFMVEQGHEVTIISSPGPVLDRFAEEEGVAAISVPMRRAVTPIADIRVLIRLTYLLLRIRPDIVHAHTPKAGLLGMLAGRLARVQVCIYHVHGLPFTTASGWRRRLLVATEWASCHMAHSVLCVSSSCLDEAHQSGVCPPTKGKALGSGSINGVQAQTTFFRRSVSETETLAATLGIPSTGRVVGFVGRLVRDKGIEELALAWATVRADYTNAYLLLVGTLEDVDPVDPVTLSALHNDPRVLMTGFVEDVAPYYSLMHVLALPSHREGFGLAALEAAACGVPVVASDIPGLVDAVVDGTTGTLVPPGNVADLAKAIASYIADEDRGVEHGAAGRSRSLADFNPESMWLEVSRHYQRAVSGRQKITQCQKHGGQDDLNL